MNLTIKIDQTERENDMPVFAPGDRIKGTVAWSSYDGSEESIELSLLFECSGKGTPQREVFTTEEIQNLSAKGHSEFSFEAADWPWSFSGKLVSLVWIVRAAAKNSSAEAEVPIIISPSASEIDLYAYEPTGEPLGRKWSRASRLAMLRQKR